MRARELRPESDDWDKLQQIIDTKCTQAQGVTLFRGTNGEPNNFLGTIRQDRRPRDSDEAEVRLFNLYMQAIGAPHRKANTLSTTTNISQTYIFGRDIHVIYPFDGSTYVFSTKMGDFKNAPRIIYQIVSMELEKWSDFTNMDDQPMLEMFTKRKDQLQEYLGFVHTSNIQDCRQARGEVLVHGTQYVALRTFDK